MKEYKTTHKIYSAWDYTREIEDLNKMSENGWQLVKGGLLGSRFKRNENIRYRYQLDFNTKIDDMGRYIETFREQGWEFVNSTWNGWHYFRKLYDASENEYEIYNDQNSLKEMQGKWQKTAISWMLLLSACFILELIMTIRLFRIPSALLTLALFIETCVIGHGAFVMRNPQRADSSKRKANTMSAFLYTLLISLAAVMVLLFLRPDGVSMKSSDFGAIGDLNNGADWADQKIIYPDNYFININADISSPVTLTIKSSKTGEIVKVINLQPGSKIDDEKIFLTPDTYKIYLSNFEGGKLNLKFELD